VPGDLPATFGRLLRQLRTDAGLSLEALAARAGVAVRTISDLELGKATSPRASTVARLAWGLRLEQPVRTRFEAVARGGHVPGGLPVIRAASPPQTLPRDVVSFTGRAAELAQIAANAAAGGGAVAVQAISGMAGVGKTALAVHAAHRLARHFPDGQIFLQLDGHTPGQRPTDPADALTSLLETAGVDARQIPPGLHARARLWRHWLAGQRVLLLLDDAADSDQVRPLLPGAAGSLVLITSRRNLTALEGTSPISLDVLTAGEAAGLLLRLADRPDLTPGDPAVPEVATLCGNLPLAVGILGRRLHYNRTWTPADLAADLAEARDRLEPLQSETVSVTAAFDLSYQDLTEGQRRMFRRLGLNPGNDTDVWAAAALDGTAPATARHHLQALYDQNLITEPARGRYRFHDLIREHARVLAAADDPPAERAAAVARLTDFYLRTAVAAARHLARRTPARAPAMAGTGPAHAPDVSTRQRAIAWMAAERLNLLAIADHAAAHGGRPHAIAIAAAMHGFLRSRGHWEQALGLHQVALEAAAEEDDPLGEATALTDLADVQYLTGDYAAAAASLARAVQLSVSVGSRVGEASALTELGVLQQATGDYPAAAASLARALDLSRSTGDRLGEASAINNAGVVQFLTGEYPAAAASQQRALELYRSIGDQLGEASALNALGGIQQAVGDYPAAAASLAQALELYRGIGDRIGEAYATGNLGAVQCITGDHPAAAASLTRALDLYRDLGSRNGEADTLNNLGALYRAAGDYGSAMVILTQALGLYRELGDQLGQAGALSELGVLQHATHNYRAAAASLAQAVALSHEIGERPGEAEALNNLGDLSLDAATPAEARDKYAQALAIASDIASPLEEARALEGIGRCLLQSDQTADGAAMLRRALALYQRIRSPHAQRVASALAEPVA
jgi:tetratricopeptide (TPR) repeat protein/DNA-binding XRE family transcriptional regulator